MHLSPFLEVPSFPPSCWRIERSVAVQPLAHCACETALHPHKMPEITYSYTATRQSPGICYQYDRNACRCGGETSVLLGSYVAVAETVGEG